VPAVTNAPWIPPLSRHVKHCLEAYRTTTEHIHRPVLATQLRSAIFTTNPQEEV
jgi:hypothetical protein